MKFLFLLDSSSSWGQFIFPVLVLFKTKKSSCCFELPDMWNKKFTKNFGKAKQNILGSYSVQLNSQSWFASKKKKKEKKNCPERSYEIVIINYFCVRHKNRRKHKQRFKLRSSHPEVFLGKSILKICSKFTGEHPCRSAISSKLLCNFLEITLRQECSPVNLLHIFRTPFPKNTSDGLLL